MKGQWIRTTKNGLNIVFIHGINSGEECWRHKNGSYWPELLKDESELADIGIYLFSYRTGINTGSYSLSDIVDSLREYFKLDNLIGSSGIIFVCHSMGGIVARRFLVNQQSVLIERGLNKIGLFLVASPSLGSEYANMLNLISNAMGHTQASALKFSQTNVWLNDLDKDFINLKINKNLQIKGKELIEDLPLYGKGLIMKQIVEPFSGAKYFGDSFKVPGSDHITIATPTNRDAVQHRLLVQFAKEFIEEFKPLISHKRSKDNSEQEKLDKEIILNDSRKYKIFTLGTSGSGKTLFLASMFRHLSIPANVNFFIKPENERQRSFLNRVYAQYVSTESWPSSTRGETEEWNFICRVQGEESLIHPVCKFSYLDYTGGRLTDMNDEYEDRFPQALEQADAFLCFLDGHKILHLMSNKSDYLSQEFVSFDLPYMLQVMQEKVVPVHFVMSKWDLLEGEFSLEMIQERLLEIPNFRNFLQGRVKAKSSAWLIPVSSVGKGFAVPEPDGSMRKTGILPSPFQVEMPFACVLADIVRSDAAKNTSKKIGSILNFRNNKDIDQEIKDKQAAFEYTINTMLSIQETLKNRFPASDLSEAVIH
jgi:hypothetical protein